MGSVGSWNQIAIMPRLQNWKNQTLDNYWQKGAGGLKKIKKKGCQGEPSPAREWGQTMKTLTTIGRGWRRTVPDQLAKKR
jgi:hypothetical protein